MSAAILWKGPRPAARQIMCRPLRSAFSTAPPWRILSKRVAVVHGDLTRTWAQTRERCYRLASALAVRGIEPGDTVSVLAPNTPAMLEAHFRRTAGRCGVLNAINHSPGSRKGSRSSCGTASAGC